MGYMANVQTLKPMTGSGVLSSEDLRSDRQRAVYDWFIAFAERGTLPSRADFDPLDFAKTISHLVLVDVEDAPRRYRVRLVGTAVVDATGRDATGNYYDATEGTEAAAARAADLVESRQARFESDLPMDWSAKDFKTYSVLSLPLSSDGANVDIIMYCLDFE
ncbi:MAG: PAS domain-containing protein [Alphaproteobacteria bacterium]|jgi:hypothetical protein|nr:PAS domain-containing protein [Alphaproteobacteria bacterium]